MRNPFNNRILGRVLNQDGSLLWENPWRPVRTLNKNFMQLLTNAFNNATGNCTDITNAVRAVNGSARNNYWVAATAVQTARGLLIGTGLTPPVSTDYKLETPATANIAHSASTPILSSFGTDGWRIDILRTFANNTGAQLDVAEVALYFYTDDAWTFCVEHSAYPVAVPIGKTLSLTYRLSVGA